MNLSITEVYDKTFDKDTYHLSTDMLQSTNTHLFIASYMWDNVHIQLNNKIPEGYLRCIKTVSKQVTVKLPAEVTETTLHQLIELYPDKSGALRRCYMQKLGFGEVLGECLVQ